MGIIWVPKTYSYKRGVCRPLEEESSFFLGLLSAGDRDIHELVSIIETTYYTRS